MTQPDLIPKYDRLMNPVLDALRALGGSGTIQEMEDTVAAALRLTDEAREFKQGRATLLGNRLAWARSYLKTYGLLVNSRRGVWALTGSGLSSVPINPRDVVQFVGKQYRRTTGNGTDGSPVDPDTTTIGETGQIENWRDELLGALKQMEPARFERLCQRLLRESGFVEVNVTGRSGDGGIDGHGMIRLQSLVSLPVVFQCKRWSNLVGPSVVRDFRGAMAGRADKGLIVTTGSFTTEATREATRAGTYPIDLIDGERLIDLMRNLGLGIEVIEQVVVDHAFLAAI
ncbi:MAG: restriction endonuclease [Chloroflexi bacterium]|nr:restriction endonuclease [Chloroflexota bacterium]